MTVRRNLDTPASRAFWAAAQAASDRARGRAYRIKTLAHPGLTHDEAAELVMLTDEQIGKELREYEERRKEMPC